MTPRHHITLIGDSTIDNKIWVSPGIVGNIIRSKLHIKRDNSADRIKKSDRLFFRPELSVVENLTKILQPQGYHIYDQTNDGFTTADVLHGADRNKVFDVGIDMFPATKFSPLQDESSVESIKKSDTIVLSIGGNNFREFIQRIMRMSPEKRAEGVVAFYPSVVEKVKDEYLLIIKRIRELNPAARLVLMTQYYPSASQNYYNIYEAMHEIGKALKLNSTEPMDVIHHLVQDIYGTAISNLKDDNTVIADITSALNPFDKVNHVSQIEPSGVGGEKIAKLLSEVITNDAVRPGFAYRINEEDDTLHATSFAHWKPHHPYCFTSYDAFNVLKNIAQARDSYKDTKPELYSAFNNIYIEGMKVLPHVKKDSEEATNLYQSLKAAYDVYLDPSVNSINALRKHIKYHAPGALNPLKLLYGAFVVLIGAVCAALAIIAPTPPLNIGLGVASATFITAGCTIFANGRRKGLAKALNNYANIEAKKESNTNNEKRPLLQNQGV